MSILQGLGVNTIDKRLTFERSEEIVNRTASHRITGFMGGGANMRKCNDIGEIHKR